MAKRVRRTPCEKCPLYSQKETCFVPGDGDVANSKLMIISESPGSLEVKEGAPLMSTSGQMVRNMIQQVGPSVYLTHAVKCWPGPGYVPPKNTKYPVPPKAVLLCREAYLEKELSEFKGKKIVTLGPVAAHSIYRKGRRVKELIGNPVEINTGVVVLSTWSPSLFIKSRNEQVLADVRRTIEWGLR